MLGFQFQRRSNVECVESPNTQPRRVPVSQLRAQLECLVGHRRLPPQILRSMIMESL